MKSSRRLVPLAVLGVATLVLPASALADRAPDRKERTGMRVAVVTSKLAPDPVQRGYVKLVRPRISTVGPWATAHLRGTGRYRRKIQPVLGLFTIKDGIFRLATVGSSGVGCGDPTVPPKVRRDLGIRCP